MSGTGTEVTIKPNGAEWKVLTKQLVFPVEEQHHDANEEHGHCCPNHHASQLEDTIPW